MGFMCGRIQRRFPPPQQRDNCGINARLSLFVTQPLSLLFVQSGCTLGICTEVPGKVAAASNRAFKGPEMKGKGTISAAVKEIK